MASSERHHAAAGAPPDTSGGISRPKTVEAEVVDAEIVDETGVRVPPKERGGCLLHSCIGCGCGTLLFFLILALTLLAAWLFAIPL